MKRSLAYLVIATVTGCYGHRFEVVPGDAAVGPSCSQYPIPFPTSSDHHAAAAVELAAVAPDAILGWDPATGTLQSVLQLDLPLTQCAAGVNTSTLVLDFVRSMPTLFHELDLAEWNAPPAIDCAEIDTNTTTAEMSRRAFGGRLIAGDYLRWELTRIVDTVTVRAVSASYLPKPPASLVTELERCNQLRADDAAEVVRQTPLGFRVLDGACTLVTSQTYTVSDADEVSVLPNETWSWTPMSSRVDLHAIRTVRVVVDETNHDGSLLASDARCLLGGGPAFMIGFDVGVDVHAGTIDEIDPGIGCDVCP